MERERAELARPDERLAAGRVLVVGLGALGCPAAWQLAAAGVGTLTLVDPDRVELSNLHRQPLHGTSAIGMAKVTSAAARLRARFPGVRIDPRQAAFDQDNGAALLAEADFVIDATDGVASKFLLNDAAVRCGRPLAHAGIVGFLGQTMTVLPGRTACYRCLFPVPPDVDDVPTCQAAGVIGAVAGVIGALQAGEAIKCLTGQGTLLADCLLTYDALTGRWRRVPLRRNPRCPVCADLAPAVLDAARGAGYGS